MTASRLKILILSLLILGVFSINSAAQAAMEIGILESDVNIEMIPENPQPYQDVTVRLSSYSTDLNKAMIQWRTGSTLLLSGYGKTSYSFKAQGPNTVTIFDVTIVPPGGDTITKKIVVAPSEIELMWQALDAYTPPFYRGKSFVSAEGAIRVVAVPNTSTIKQGKGNISYSWNSGGNAAVDASGYNKDSYVFLNSSLNTTETVSVAASSIDGRYSASNSIKIPIVTPRVLFYKRSPTEGVLYNQALSNDMTMSEDEMTVVVAPYYLALKGHEDLFSYAWKINGSSIETPSKRTELTVHPTSRGGYATISITLENLSALFQKATGQLKLNL